MTTIQRSRIVQSAWTEWPDPPRATLRAVVTVAGSTVTTVDDISAALAAEFSWGEYGVTIFPESTLPLDTPDAGEARLEIGALVVMTDPNQGMPEFEDGSPNPAVSDVRIRLEQPISQDLADRPMLLQRRVDIENVISRLYGTYDMERLLHVEPVRPVTGRAYSSAYSPAYG